MKGVMSTLIQSDYQKKKKKNLVQPVYYTSYASCVVLNYLMNMLC